MTFKISYVILLPIHEGGDCIYALVLYVFSIFLSYYIISTYYVSIKSKFINNKYFNSIKLNINFFESKLSRRKNILNNLGNPYGINIFKFNLIKYIISPVVFFLVILRSHNIFLSLIYSLCFFYIPNFLIYVYTKNESVKIINDISEISNNLRLALSCNIPLHESLKYVKDSIEYIRFREGFDLFINDYLMYNFNIIKAIDNFKLKFDSYEFNMFLNIIIQGDREGKIVESLSVFSETLELSYFKYLKYKETKRIMFVTIASIISLINITILAIYPIAIQISENLQNIFN